MLKACFRHSLLALFLLGSLLYGTASAFALTVQDVRIGLHPDKTRMVLELSEISKFRTFVLENPWRLVIDMPDFDWQAGKISNPSASAIKTIRQGTLQPGISRIVVDLKRPVILKTAFLLRKSEGKPDRLVIDFVNATRDEWLKQKDKSLGILDVNQDHAAAPPPAEKQQQSRTAQTKTQAKAAPPAPPVPPQTRAQSAPLHQVAASGMAIPGRKPVQAAPPPLEHKPLIVLDPGHGGVDPGAIGANGVFEKHVSLAMAKDLKNLLESTGRYDVILTRTTDTYLRLYQRVEFARRHNADLFISLHADSIGKPDVHGASVYTLSEKASDKQTARLAERENKADIIAGTDLTDEDQQVANILIDLAMRDTMNQSKFFANTIAGSMDNTGVNTLERPHRSAGFAVLKAPDIPSVLIELGFMSNRHESQMLSRHDYREKIARALASSIDAYFEKIRRNHRT